MATENLQSESGVCYGGNWDELAPEVLEMIFCHLPVKDLLSCSLLSKNWKTVARDVLKRSKECYFHIKDFHRDVQVLNEMIASTGLMEMINGLHIRNELKLQDEPGSASSSSQQAGEKLKKAKPKINEVLRVQWRYLNLNMGRSSKRLRLPALSRADASVLKELILATSGSLEKLVIGQERDWKFIPCNGNEYSKLKVIQLLNHQHRNNIRTRIFSPTCAPKLEEITGAMMELDVDSPVDCFMTKRMKSISLSSALEVPEGESKEAFGYISGLRQLDLQCYHYEDDPEQQQDLVSWNAFVFSFVLRSLDTLQELHMYIADFYNLFKKSQALKLPNLRHLGLATHPSVFVETEIPALKQLNLAKLCPNLEKLILFGEANVGEMETEVIAPLEAGAGLYQSDKPMQIVLECNANIEMHVHEYLTFFNEVYPNITQVRILNLKDTSLSNMGSMIWDMNSLEYLEISIDSFWTRTYEFLWGLDALLSGINIEEAILLFEDGRKKNTKMNAVIVPIRPSLFGAKKLKEMKITQDTLSSRTVSKCCVIRITDNLPVRHERELKVTLEGSKEFYNKLKLLRAFSGFKFMRTE